MQCGVLRFNSIVFCFVLMLFSNGCLTNHQESKKDAAENFDSTGTSASTKSSTFVDRPADFATGVEQLKMFDMRLRTQLQTGDAAGSLGILAQLFDVLKVLPELAADSALAESEWNRAHASIRELSKFYQQWQTKIEASEKQLNDADAEQLSLELERLSALGIASRVMGKPSDEKK